MRRFHFGTTVVLLLSVLVGNALGTAEYTVTDPGTLGGTVSVADSINDSGQVVGMARINGSSFHAFLHSGTGPLNPVTDDLGTFGGPNSRAWDINDSGQAVGYAETSSGAPHAFLYSGSSPPQDLGTFGGTSSVAEGINDSGQVVGYSDTASGFAQAFLHNGGGPLNPVTDDLGTFGGTSSSANGINDSGQVVGWADTNSYDASGNPIFHAFLHRGSGPLNPVTDDLGTLAGTTGSVATGINNNGQVVGYASNSSGSLLEAFLYSGSGPLQALGTFGGTLGEELGINSGGQVVGYADTGSGADHAFLYNGSGSIQDLNDLIGSSGWTLSTAAGINDSGQIVGTGYNAQGQEHAFLLTPRPRALRHHVIARLGRLPDGLRLAATKMQLVRHASQSKAPNQRAIHCGWFFGDEQPKRARRDGSDVERGSYDVERSTAKTSWRELAATYGFHCGLERPVGHKNKCCSIPLHWE